MCIRDRYEVIILSRSDRENRDGISFCKWDVDKRFLDQKAFTVDHVINLAGAGIADRPWTKTRKKELRESRLASTSFLFDQYVKNKTKLKTYLGASAIGYYGDGGDKWQKEYDSPTSSSFMTKLCKDWENAHLKFQELTDSVSIFRIGICLLYTSPSPRDATLSRMPSSA